MKRRAAACLLAILMVISACGAFAEPVSNAGAMVQMQNLEKYPSFVLDKESGTWSVSSIRADSLQEMLEKKAGTLASRGVVNMRLEIGGNEKTGVLVPVLEILYAGSTQLNVSAVSIAMDGVRYDLAAVSYPVAIGRSKGEEIRVALDAQGIDMVRKMAESGECSICLQGEKCYETNLKLEDEYESEKALIESESLKTLDVLSLADWDAYDLWDLTAALWMGETGAEIRVEKSAVEAQEEDSIFDEVFGLVKEDSAAQKQLQEMLEEAGFFYGKTETNAAERIRLAVERAQQYYGLLVTGCADQALCDALAGAELQAEEIEAAELFEAVNGECSDAQSGVVYELEQTARVCLNRYWFAKTLAAAGEETLFTHKALLNESNVLWMADGMVQNLSAQTLNFYSDLTAVLVYNGAYEYECTVVCERDNGAGFDSVLLPMAQSRLVVYAEIPQELARADGQWQLKVEAGGEGLTYQLN